jgi:ferric-dicitrate binding protein FerR (iron transport regulator)
MKTAAILLLPVLIAGGLMLSFSGRNDNKTVDSGYDATIYAPMGSRVSFNLPDGTSGMLNSGSYLSYSFSRNGLREASLSGEAWFEVESDPENPFLISAGRSTVKVTGTRFNLSAYPSENYVEVVLDEGRVEFRNDNTDDFILLKPSERLISQNGDIKKSSVDPDKYHAWTDGKLVFKNDPMEEVVRRIERWYNVKISVEDDELEKYSFRATFQDDSVEEVLKFLALTSPIGYKITPRIIGHDGSYVKQEITIYKTE